MMIFESWPPISRMVWTSGRCDRVPIACAVISFFTVWAESIAPMSSRADPVVPTETTRASASRACGSISASRRRTAPTGFPSVHRYEEASTVPCSSSTAALVEMEPTSTPR